MGTQTFGTFCLDPSDSNIRTLLDGVVEQQHEYIHRGGLHCECCPRYKHCCPLMSCVPWAENLIARCNLEPAARSVAWIILLKESDCNIAEIVSTIRRIVNTCTTDGTSLRGLLSAFDRLLQHPGYSALNSAAFQMSCFDDVVKQFSQRMLAMPARRIMKCERQNGRSWQLLWSYLTLVDNCDSRVTLIYQVAYDRLFQYLGNIGGSTSRMSIRNAFRAACSLDGATVGSLLLTLFSGSFHRCGQLVVFLLLQPALCHGACQLPGRRRPLWQPLRQLRHLRAQLIDRCTGGGGKAATRMRSTLCLSFPSTREPRAVLKRFAVQSHCENRLVTCEVATWQEAAGCAERLSALYEVVLVFLGQDFSQLLLSRGDPQNQPVEESSAVQLDVLTRVCRFSATTPESPTVIVATLGGTRSLLAAWVNEAQVPAPRYTFPFCSQADFCAWRWVLGALCEQR